jgi:hypothetical protein
MKKISYLSLFLLIYVSCTQQGSKFPQGAWKQYSSESYVDGKLTDKQIVTYNNMKLFSEKKWEFVWKIQTDSMPYYNYGAGSYTLNGKDYSETIEMHVAKEYVGQTINMTLELKLDTLIQTWNPIDSTGKPSTRVSYVDKYIHLK